MKFPELPKVTKKLYRYDLVFNKNVIFAQSVMAKKNFLDCGFSYLEQGSLPQSLNAKKVFYQDKVYIQGDDYRIWEYDGLKFIPIAEPNGEAFDVCLSEKGTKKFISTPNGLMVLAKKNYFYPGKTIKFMCFFAEKLFASDGKDIFYYEDDFSLSNTIYIDKVYGKIVGLCKYANKIYIFCEKAIYALTPKFEGIDFNLERLSYQPNGVRANSVKQCNFGFIFAEKDCITRYEGGIFKKVSNLFGAQTGGAVLFEKNYLFPVKYKGKNFYYCLAIEDDVYYYIGRENLLLADNGFFVNKKNNTVGLFSKEGTSDRIYVTREDFNQKSNKHLSMIRFDTDGKLQVLVEGETGKLLFSVNEGVSDVNLSMLSHNFTITLKPLENNFFVSSISFFYKKSGR